MYILWSRWSGSSRINWVSRAHGSHSSNGTELPSTDSAGDDSCCGSITPASIWNVSHVGQWASRRACTASTCSRGTETCTFTLLPNKQNRGGGVLVFLIQVKYLSHLLELSSWVKYSCKKLKMLVFKLLYYLIILSLKTKIQSFLAVNMQSVCYFRRLYMA